jgi:hypothetical protein
MNVGFTGTQKGLTKKQYSELKHWLKENKPYSMHHGDCIGADAEAHVIAVSLNIATFIHPPICNSKRSFRKADYTYPPKPYLERNHDIVDSCDTLIACPKSRKRELRSGTWATVRYAEKKKKPLIIIYPEYDQCQQSLPLK